MRVMGAGFNRSELRTRQGHSPSVTFPRVLGIECVGVVAASTDPCCRRDDCRGGDGEMGREFDGGYAEYVLLPNSLLMPVTPRCPGTLSGATGDVPDRQARWTRGDRAGWRGRLLIRGGTSSVGMAAASIASGYGVEIAATTRRQEKVGALTAAGVDHVLVDGGGSHGEHAPVGPRAGPRSGSRRGEHPVDSLHLVRRGGTVCVAGSLSGWLIRDFEPIAMIPSGRAHGFPQPQPQGQRGRDRAAAGRPRDRGRRLSTQHRPGLRPGRHRCGPPVHGKQRSHREACRCAIGRHPGSEAV